VETAITARPISLTNQRRRDEESGEELAAQQEQHQLAEDVTVIKSSLNFINDLLRTMLDVNKIDSRQLVLQPTPTDLYSDILEPI
jgi:hypothetical protein